MATELGNVANSLSDPAQNAAVDIANQQVLDTHAALKTVGDDLNIDGAVHGLTDVGETAGFGKIGESNLITDVAQAPGNTLNGASPTGEVSTIVTDSGEVVEGTGHLITGLGSDLANPHVVNDALDGTTDHVGQIIDVLPASTGGGSGEPIISVDAGEAGGSPILDAGILASPNGGAPISVAAGSGENAVDLNALGDSGLQLPDLGGAGTDSLSGIVSGLGATGIVSDGADASPGSETHLADIHTDGSALVQLDGGHPDALVGVNTHTVL